MKKLSIFMMFITYFSVLVGITYAQDSYPLLDEKESPETKTAMNYFSLLRFADHFDEGNHGTIGYGFSQIDKSYNSFSKEYKSQVSLEEYRTSFQNMGEFKLIQLYSASSENEKAAYFELSAIAGEENFNKKLFLGGDPPETTGASTRYYTGAIHFKEEDGVLKIDKINYKSEFPIGGGHQPYRDSAEYMAQLAMGDGYSNDDMDTKNCITREVHPNNLVYVTCTDQTGQGKKTAKMVQPTNNADGWECIQVSDGITNSGVNEHLILGKKWFQLKKFKKAIAQYQQAIQDDPNDFKAYELMGYSYLRDNQIPEAIKSLEKSVALKPEHIMGHYNLAIAYWTSGNKQKKAIAEVKKVIDLDPTFKEKIKDDTQFHAFKSSEDFNELIKP